MASNELDLVARFQAAMATGDFDAVVQLVHPEFEVVQSRALPYGGSYRGREGFLQFLGIFFSTWKMEKFEAVGRYNAAVNAPSFYDVVIQFHLVGSAVETGEPIDTTLLEQWTFKDGLLYYSKPHWFVPPRGVAQA